MNEAQYVLLGVAVGAFIPAVAVVWQTIESGKQAKAERRFAQEQRRDDHRLALVASWRTGLAALLAETGTDTLDGVNPLYLREWYLSLRPHLSEDARKRAEPGPRTSVAGGHRPYFFLLSDEIARVEREWGLA